VLNHFISFVVKYLKQYLVIIAHALFGNTINRDITSFEKQPAFIQADKFVVHKRALLVNNLSWNGL